MANVQKDELMKTVDVAGGECYQVGRCGSHKQN